MIGLQVNIDFVMPVRISTGIFFALKCRLFSDHLKVPSGYTHIVTRKEIIPDAFRRLEADGGRSMMERTIRVTGKGKLSVKPDMIRLRINIEGMYEEYDETLRKSSDCVEILKDLIEKLGYERKELKTLYFNIDTEYESYQARDKSWKRRFKGYKYVHRMKLEFPADNKRLGKILYALAHCSVSPEFTIEYTVADPEKSKNELLGAAVKDSQAKASVLAEAAGVNLGKIINIDYSWGEIDFVSRPLQEMSLRCCEPEECESASYDMDIEPDDIDISDTVTVIWGLED